MEPFVYKMLTFLIVACAFGILGYKIYKKLVKPQTNACDSGCGGCATPCDLKDVVNKKANKPN